MRELWLDFPGIKFLAFLVSFFRLQFDKNFWFDLTINVTEDAMKLLSKQEWLFSRLLNPFLCVVKLKLLLEAVIDSRFALVEILSKGDLAVLYTFEEQTPETTER